MIVSELVSFWYNMNSYIIHILMIKIHYREWIVLSFNGILEYILSLNIYLCEMPSEILLVAYIIQINEYTALNAMPFFSSSKLHFYLSSWSHTFVATTQVTS